MKRVAQTARSMGRLLHVPIVSAQIIWAIPQALVIVLIANRGNFEQLGAVTLALSVYTPGVLALGFNLRNEIAVDQGQQLDHQAAMVMRAITTLTIALSILAFLFWAINDYGTILLCAAIMCSRVVDQITDISVGIYQQQGNKARIARSLFGRGAAQIMPLAACFVMPIPVLYACTAAFCTSALTALTLDWLSVIGEPKNEPLRIRIIQLWNNLTPRLWTSPFPSLDSISANMSKYSAGYFLPLAAVGQIGIAYSLYMPLAMFITSIGYSHLTNTIRARDAKNFRKVRETLLVSMSLALAAAFAVLVVTVYAPDGLFKLLGIEPESNGRAIVVMTLAALLPQAVLGFACQTMITLGRRKAYVSNPLLGIITFIALATLIQGSLMNMTPAALMSCLFFAGCVRLIHATYYALTGERRAA